MRLKQKLLVGQSEEEAEVWQTSRWLNRDNVPLPPSRRTWGPWSYVGFWITTGVNISGWSGGSALLSLGLTVGQSMAVAVIGNLLVATCVVLTGLVGARWHVGFPMWNRMTWGLWGSLFPLANRIILSFTWSSTQAWFGGQVLKTLLGSLAPSIYTMRNVFPASTHMDSADFLCFIIFLLLSFPLLHIPPEKFRKPFIVAAITSSITASSLLIWSVARARGGGPLLSGSQTEYTGIQPAKGAALAWAMFYGISSQMGGICAGILNMSDYTRFAVKPGDQVWSQIFVVPIMSILTCLIGIVCTSCAAQFYPEAGLLWTPYGLLSTIQANGGNGARAAVFFASLAFLIAQFGINIAGNAISGGIDLASLFPRYINIRRGAYITTLMALPMCPWALLSGATVFISVMGGYATFLGPMTGVMVFDYVVVRKQKMKLSSLYDASSSSIYWYWRGINWRAPVAWVLGVAPLFPGFLGEVSTISIPIGLQHAYYLCFPREYMSLCCLTTVGFTISGLLYWSLATLFPIPHLGEIDDYDVFGTFGQAETSAKDLSNDSEKNDAVEPVVAVLPV
ncbi:NCS1 nucleoside transporter family [Kockovaella imperatae]|uniref:NCS1 nucleoside transporter family n=1 Tax=Kockovaella imperatae TaxID=4999 RepID=A0A1Y1UQK7_9TREE|nr:NCS1 nucleoside transporter family [Kockovaella imperatae]ORX40323.1 NCS1 nucleoside transporter family [Kockovaella imperatae]